MDPILEEFLQMAEQNISIYSDTITGLVNQGRINTIEHDFALNRLYHNVRADAQYFIDKYRDKPNVNPQTLTQIRVLSNYNKLKEFLNAANLASEAAKAGIPEAQVAAVVEEALTTGTPLTSLESAQPILNRLPAESLRLINQSTLTPNVPVNPATAIYQAADIPTSARQAFSAGRGITVPSSVSSNPAYALPNQARQLFEAGRNLAQSGGVTTRPVPEAVRAATQASGALPQVESSIAQAESVSPTVARSLTQTIMGAGSTALSGLAALGARVFGNRAVQGLVGTGLVGAAIWSANNPSETPAPPKSVPEIPIGPSAMQNLPSAAPPAPSADVQRRTALKDQLRNAPDSTAKWDAYASVLYEEIVANDEELAKVRQELDTLPATATDAQKQALAIRYNTASTNRNSLRDDYTKALENKDKAAKEAVANSPENLALVRQATQASIDAQSASAAASRASAARSAVEAAAIEAKRIRDEQMGPVELAAAEQSLKNAQILGAKAEVDLQLIQADQRQRAAVDVLQSKFDAGELTEEQFTTQALAASGKIEQLATYRLNLQRNQDAREQAAIQQGNWEKSFGLQQQAAAIAQTEAVANREFRQSQLALQQAAEARAAAQARAQNMQALTAAQTQRQAAYNQAATEYERFGVATPNRIQGLQDLKAPLPAAQAAGMLGLDVNSPEFKAVYDTYSMALAPGQGAQQPVPAAPAPAPAPAPNPVTNSIPLISMPSMGNTPYLTQALGGLKTGYSPA